MNIDFPFHFDPRGHTATTTYEDHIYDMIEQFLFTRPGERVNRPDFGSGLLQLLFEPNSPELEGALKFTIQAGLQRWLNDVIVVRALDVSRADSALNITVQYSVRQTNEDKIARFERKVEHGIS
jgi:phage baseplate assembly protein W